MPGLRPAGVPRGVIASGRNYLRRLPGENLHRVRPVVSRAPVGVLLGRLPRRLPGGIVNTRKMARKLAAHGQACDYARRGQGRLAGCPCGRSVAWLCPCGSVVRLRGGSCADYAPFAGARRDMVIYS